jgi:hypothetical protein
MKQIIFYFIFLIGFASLQANAQVIIQPQASFKSMFSIDDLYAVTLINPTLTTYNGVLSIKITSATSQVIFTSQSTPFNLVPGSFSLPPFFSATCSKIFGSSQAAMSFSQTGLLPSGSFEICYQFTAIGEPGVVGINCNQQVVQPFMPPYLVDPANKEIINTTYPRLVWHPPAPVDLATIRYSIKLNELKKGQSYAAALNQNVPLLQASNLLQAQLSYPSTAGVLETGHAYVWQVAAFDGNESLGITEIWSFRIDQTTVANKMTVDESFYPRVEDFQSDGFYLTNGTIRFAFTNRSSDTALICEVTKIPDDSTGNGVIDSVNIVPEMPALPINYGMNELSIDLSTWDGWIEDGFYRVEVTDADLRNYFLIYQYVLPE